MSISARPLLNRVALEDARSSAHDLIEEVDLRNRRAATVQHGRSKAEALACAMRKYQKNSNLNNMAVDV